MSGSFEESLHSEFGSFPFSCPSLPCWAFRSVAGPAKVTGDVTRLQRFCCEESSYLCSPGSVGESWMRWIHWLHKGSCCTFPLVDALVYSAWERSKERWTEELHRKGKGHENKNQQFKTFTAICCTARKEKPGFEFDRKRGGSDRWLEGFLMRILPLLSFPPMLQGQTRSEGCLTNVFFLFKFFSPLLDVPHDYINCCKWNYSCQEKRQAFCFLVFSGESQHS